MAGLQRRTLLWALAALVLVALLLAAIWGWRTVDELGRIGTANKAKLYCSAVFVSGREPASVLEAELAAPGLDRVTADLDFDGHRVSATMLWSRADVIYRPGIGCTRLVDLEEEALRDQIDLQQLPTAPDLTDEPWPRGDLLADQSGLDYDRNAVEAVVARAFADPDPDHPVGTRAVAVVWRGHLISERYAPGFGMDVPLAGWSMTKSLTAALFGLRVQDGALDLMAPAPVAEWQQDDDPRAAITLDQLLRMSSGLAFSEVYELLQSDAVRMLFADGGADMAAFAAAMPLAAEPDTHWNYASGTTNLLQRILRESFPDLVAYHRYVRERLLYPLGMTRTVIAPDEAGNLVGSSFGYGTARDWARLGLLHLQRGQWHGRQLLPAAWVDYSITPTAADPQGRYGAHWWLNAGPEDDPRARPWPQLPADAYRASGFEGQYVMVVPSADLVVVRMGYTPDRDRFSMATLTRELIDALPVSVASD